VSQNLSNDDLKLTDIIPTNYSRDNAPVVGGKPVEVNVSITVLSLIPSSDADMVWKKHSIEKNIYWDNFFTWIYC